MNNSELHKIIEIWLEDPANHQLLTDLEERIENDSEALASFRKLQKDYAGITGSNQIQENPFFFQKLKFRMERRGEEKSHVQGVRWAVYAATMSFSLIMGVMLGNQVESTQNNNTTIQASSEEIFAQEFLVADYSIDNVLLIEIEE